MNYKRDPVVSWSKNKIGSRMALLLTSVLILCCIGGTEAESKEKITIGFVEDIILLPWGVKLPARIDTGAAQSSLDARDITIRNNIVEFTLPEKYGGLRLSLPIVSWKTVRSAEAIERRPVVMMEFCLGDKNIRARVNLNNRSQVKYPFLLGRNALRKNFIINCTKEKCAPPTCPKAQTN